MATMTSRWSREAARARWAELGAFDGRAVGVGIPVMGLWPLAAMIGHWQVYADHVTVIGIYVASVALPMTAWWFGSRGITLAGSLLSIAAALGLTVALVGQIDLAHPAQAGIGFWLDSWASATFFVLAFARPVEEPLVGFLALTAINYVVHLPPDADLYILQNTPGRVGAAFPAAVSILSLIAALRIGVRNVKRGRELAAAAEQQLAVTEAVAQERTVRFVTWEGSVAPLLDDLATGRRDITDPTVSTHCRWLAAQLRAQLSAVADSLFVALLATEAADLRGRGGELTISDVDVGFRLREPDRVMLAALVSEVCAQPSCRSVELTLLTAAGDTAAVVVLFVSGAAVPDTTAWAAAHQNQRATLSVDSPSKWYWDATLALDPAPALPVATVVLG